MANRQAFSVKTELQVSFAPSERAFYGRSVFFLFCLSFFLRMAQPGVSLLWKDVLASCQALSNLEYIIRKGQTPWFKTSALDIFLAGVCSILAYVVSIIVYMCSDDKYSFSILTLTVEVENVLVVMERSNHLYFTRMYTILHNLMQYEHVRNTRVILTVRYPQRPRHDYRRVCSHWMCMQKLQPVVCVAVIH